jgi:hypothetical protein
MPTWKSRKTGATGRLVLRGTTVRRVLHGNPGRQVLQVDWCYVELQ